MNSKSCCVSAAAKALRNESLAPRAALHAVRDTLFVVCLSLLAFGLVNALMSVAVALAARWLRFDCLPRARARRYLFVRAFPGAASLLFVGAVFLPVLCRTEPGNSDEQLSLAMCVLAIAAILILVIAMNRGLHSVWSTWRLSRSWERGARPLPLAEFPIPAYLIEAEFPIVAIVGIRRQRLYVASKVLAKCSAEEIEAILSHERAHIRHGDNLVRLCVRFFPDVLAFTSVASWLERGWARSCEEAADDEAVATGKGLALASALCTISRMARGASPVAGTGIHGDGEVAHRLNRLLRPDSCVMSKSRGRFDGLRFALLLALPLIVATVELPRLHAATEAVVRLLK
jgi:hypothetical protein